MMPALLIGKVEFVKRYYIEDHRDKEKHGRNAYVVSILTLPQDYPIILEEGWKKHVSAYACWLFSKDAKPIFRFSPPEKLSLEVIGTWEKGQPGFLKLKIPGDFINRHGISAGSYIVMVIIKIGETHIFPYECKVLFDHEDPVARNISNRVAEFHEDIGLGTVSTIYRMMGYGKEELAEIAQYLFDGWHRHQEGDIEGSITQLRKATELLLNKIFPGIKQIEGIKELRKRSEKLTQNIEMMISGLEGVLKTLKGILSVGGPHPIKGLTPRWTSLLALRILSAILEYIGRVVYSSSP